MDAILPYICGAHNGKKLITVCLSSSFPRWPPFFVQPPSIRAIDSSTDQKSEGGSESEPPATKFVMTPNFVHCDRRTDDTFNVRSINVAPILNGHRRSIPYLDETKAGW